MSSLKRRLAAIVFTDIVGFTNLSSKDEEGAYKLVVKQREILKPIVESFSITLVIVPILLWGGMTISPDSSATTVEKYGSNVLPFVSIRNTLYYSHWSCIFIVLLSLMEGSQANKLYLQIGETITFDRYYALKFLLAPIFLLYLYIGFSTILAFIAI